MQFLDNSDFQKIETELGIQLPAHFKKFHLGQRDLIQELARFEEDLYVMVTAKSFIEINSIYAFHTSKPKVCIGQDGGGGVYLMDISPDSVDEIVYTIPHYLYSDEEEADMYDDELKDYKWHDERCQEAANLVDFTTEQLTMLREVYEGA